MIWSRLRLSGDVWGRCCQPRLLQAKPWRNSSNKNSRNLEYRDPEGVVLQTKRLGESTDIPMNGRSIY